MKRILRKLFVLTLGLSLTLMPLEPSESLGAGTPSDPYLITTCTELQNMNQNLNAHYALANNIDCSETSTWNGGQGFVPIGRTSPFYGSFEGRNHSIADLFMHPPHSPSKPYIGLFGFLMGPVKDLTLLRPVVISDDAFTGAIAGFAGRSLTKITIANGRVESRYADSNIGGAVGGLQGVELSGISFQGVISAPEGNLGGIAAQASDTTGLGLSANIDGTTANGYAGGLFGLWDGTTSSSLTDSFSVGTITSPNNDATGGLIGYVIPEQNYQFHRNYASVKLPPLSTSGGLIGSLVSYYGVLSHSSNFWDQEVSGTATTASNAGLSKTTAEMKNQATYAGWDFTNTWMMTPGNYPTLRSPPPPSVASSSFMSSGIQTKKATLSWNPNPDAADYILRRNGSEIYRGPLLTFTDTGLTPATDYTYELTASNAGGVSPAMTASVRTKTDEWIQVSSGYFHSLGLKEDGSVWAWGQNDRGQIGDGTTVTRYKPVRVPSLADVTFIEATELTSAAVKRDGTVWTWGDFTNTLSASGSSAASSTTPLQAKGEGGAGVLTTIKSISLGSSFVLAQKTDGTLLSWGSGADGQLGTGGSSSTYPVKVKGPGGTGFLTGVASFAAGGFHSIAVLSDSTVHTWGLNNRGQLGINSTVKQNYPTPVQGAGTSGGVFVDADYDRSHLVKSDGTIHSWGFNYMGVLGDGTSTTRHLPVRSGTLATVTRAAAGNYQTLTLLNDGTVHSWGEGTFGKLATGTTTNYNSPVPTYSAAGTRLTGVASLSAGLLSSYFLKTDGTLWASGGNSSGNLGTGSRENALYPVRVGVMTPAPNPASSSFTSSGITQTAATLTWTNNLKATRFILKRNGVTVFTGLATSHADSGLTPGTTYTYELTAENESGSSPPMTRSVTTAVPRTVNLGTVAPTLTLSNIPVTGLATTATGTIGTLQATHTGGNSDGWKITASATPFTRVGGSDTLPPGSLRLQGTPVVSLVSGSALLPAAQGSGPWILDSGPVVLVRGAANQADGVYHLTYGSSSLRLSVDTARALIPSGSPSSAYRSVLTYIISTGP